jgi:uncharacterized protein (TIGR00730 family)
MIKSIGVFCGSSVGAKEIYTTKARELGKLMAEQDITLVFGGGKVGLMGVIADSVMEHGGKAIGVITHYLENREVGHPGITDLHVVDTMSDRKNLIADLSDGFIAMPGGFGTFDEVMEVLTYFQLGISEKPTGFLNVDGFYNHLIAMMDHVLEEKFMKYEHRHNVLVDAEPNALLEKMLNFEPLELPEKWIQDLKNKNTY